MSESGIEMAMSRKEREEKEKADYEDRIRDPVAGSIGDLGPWQIWICVVIFMMKFPVGWHQLATVFLAPPTSFECAVPNNLTDKCSDECTQLSYDRSIFKETIVTEWNLVCGKRYLASLVQTLFMFGILVGNIIFGIWSDKVGRRPPLVFSVLMQLFCGVLDAFVPWFWVFCTFRFLLGVATGGSMVTSFVLVMEITGTKKREIMSILYQIPFNLGHMTLPLFAYFLRDWRWYQFAISIISVIFISYYWLIPESPRWLMSAGQLENATKVLEKAAIANNRPIHNIRTDLDEWSRRKAVSKEVKKGTFLDLFRYPNLRMKTICITINWFVCGLTYFGVSQYVGELSGDIFTNVAIAGTLGIPGTLISIATGKYLGRKRSLMVSNTLAGCCMLAIAFVPPSNAFLKVGLASIGVFGMAVSFPIVYLYGGEMFPTVVRNAGMGFASMLARIGSMSAPFVSQTASIAHWIPPVIFGVVPLIGTILVIFLPETKGAPLPETIEDGENFGKKTPKASVNDDLKK